MNDRKEGSWRRHSINADWCFTTQCQCLYAGRVPLESTPLLPQFRAVGPGPELGHCFNLKAAAPRSDVQPLQKQVARVAEPGTWYCAVTHL